MNHMGEGMGEQSLDIPKNPHEGRLIPEVAAEEAALMQAFLKKITKQERRVLGGEQPSKEDYTNALVAIEELQEAAREEEGTRDERIDKMMRILVKLGHMADKVVDALSGDADTEVGKRLRADTEEQYRSALDIWTSAREKLQELRDIAHGMQ